jgi:hypothetical protein
LPLNDLRHVQHPLIAKYHIVEIGVGEYEVATPRFSWDLYLETGHGIDRRVATEHTNVLRAIVKTLYQMHQIIIVHSYVQMTKNSIKTHVDSKNLSDYYVIRVAVLEFQYCWRESAYTVKICSLSVHIKR